MPSGPEEWLCFKTWKILTLSSNYSITVFLGLGESDDRCDLN